MTANQPTIRQRPAHHSTGAMWMGLAAVLVIGALAGVVLEQLNWSSADRFASSSTRVE